MIKFETKEGISKIEMKGDISELCADVCTFLTAMHKSLKEDNEVVADCFEHMLREHMLDMVFSDDRKSEMINLKKKKKEEDGDIDDDIKELIEGLEELVKLMKNE